MATLEGSRQSDAGLSTRHVQIAILGTGFSGLGIAIRLKQRGYNDFVVLERATEVGGNWRDSTYPGCACNVPSSLYSFSFAPNPDWEHEYPAQPEIHAYLRDCAKRFDVLSHIRWNAELLAASWSEDDQFWQLTTTQGKFTATIFICGNGQLTEPLLPSIQGLETFEGVLFHSAQWRHDYDLTGKRVAVIGTGASAVQFVPQIQPLVAQLALFQRTPSWILPYNAQAISERQRAIFRKFPLVQRIERAKIYIRHELPALKITQHPRVMKLGTRMTQRYLEEQVPDLALRAKLTPHGSISTVPILRSDHFYSSLGQPNVEVITEGIQEIRANSIVTRDGKEYNVDTIICGTGFHVTDAQFPQRICGRGGLRLSEKLHNSLCAYLGTTVAGFPNLFWMCGPGTSLPHSSMVCIVEDQINYILGCLRLMKRRKLQAVELQERYQQAYTEEMLRRNESPAKDSSSSPTSNRYHDVLAWPGSTTEFWFRTRRFNAQCYELSPRKEHSARTQSV